VVSEKILKTFFPIVKLCPVVNWPSYMIEFHKIIKSLEPCNNISDRFNTICFNSAWEKDWHEKYFQTIDYRWIKYLENQMPFSPKKN
jgi:hypothetical protein